MLIKKAIVRAIPIFWGEWELSFYSATGSASIWPTLLFGPRFAFFSSSSESENPKIKAKLQIHGNNQWQYRSLFQIEGDDISSR